MRIAIGPFSVHHSHGNQSLFTLQTYFFYIKVSDDIVADCTCQSLTVSTQNQPSAAGVYRATALTFGGKVVYKMPNTAAYLYYWNAGVQYWLIGNTLGVSRGIALGYLTNVTTSMNPQFVTRWRYYNYTTQLWTDDNTMSISCTCKDLVVPLNSCFHRPDDKVILVPQ